MTSYPAEPPSDFYVNASSDRPELRSVLPQIIAILAVLLMLSSKERTVSQDSGSASEVSTLRRFGVEASSEGVREFLQQAIPGRERNIMLKRLIEQLGADLYIERHSASIRLMTLPAPPIKKLQLAASSDNLEISYRAKKILSLPESQRWTTLHAVFKTIGQKKIVGATQELLRISVICEDSHLSTALHSAVRSTATMKDVQLFRAAFENEHPAVVVTAIVGLRAALGPGSREDIRRLTSHKSDKVILAASRELADQGDRSSLQTLAKLLSSNSLEVRIGAARSLRQATGIQQSYSAWEDEASRKLASKRWMDWIEKEGGTAKLHTPLGKNLVEQGRTLITIAQQNRVVELNDRGEQIWESKKLKNPWGCIGLTSANRLVTSRDGHSVVQFDSKGKEIWRKDGLPEAPINVQRLENGNTLIAFFAGQKVMEIRPDGSTAWEIEINGGPVDARRLDEGRTLVTLHQPDGRVVELDRAGKVLWSINDLKQPMTAQRLENGNTLIAEYGSDRVAEWDRNGKIQWQAAGIQRPYSAQRLANGNTLIAHATDVREVSREGELVWQLKMTQVRHATRY